MSGLSRKISQLNPGATPLSGTELIPIVQNGETRYVPASALAAGIAIANNLTTNSSEQALSASMGVTLKQLIDDLTGVIHKPVSINSAAANGLGIDSNQVLSMALAGGSQAGALSSADWTLFSGKVGGALNVGTNPQSLGLFIDKQGADLRFKKIRAGSNVTLSEDADGIIINSTGGSGTGITLADARAGISETITGIDYNNTTGVFSLDAGYVIPTQGQLDAKLNKLPAITAATHPVISYNTDGLVTGGRALNTSDIPDLPQSKITNLVSTLAGKLGTTLAAGTLLLGNASGVAAPVAPSGDWTISPAGVATLKDVVEPNQYFRVTVDPKGRVTSGQSSLLPENIPVLPLTKLNTAGAQEGWVITSEGGEAKWAAPSGGGGPVSDGRRIYERWQQQDSGLAAGNAVRYDPALPGWVKAAADTPDNAARAIGIVADVNSTSVEVTYQGIIDISSISLSGNTGNTRYYLPTSANLAGILTTTAPTANGQVRKEMLLTLPGGLAFFRPWEHVVVGSGGSIGTITLSGAVFGSGSGTIETTLTDGAVTATKLATDSVLTAKIAAGAVTGAKIAQAGATLGQALLWTANGWAPGTVSTSPGTSFTPTLSLQFASGTTNLQLVGDAAGPGNDRYYGTGPTGIKGYHPFPTSSGIGDYVKLNSESTGDAAITGTFSAAVVRAVNTLSIGGPGANANISVDNLTTDRTYLLRGTSNATEQIAFLSDITGISPGTQFTSRWSISLVSGQMNLAGDVATPAANQYYGTNASSVRGWYNLPAGGSGPSSITTLTLANTALATGISYDTAFGRVQGQLNAKGTYSLPAGGSAGQYINGLGALTTFPAPATFTLRYKPSAATSGNSYQTWAELYAAFLTTTGYITIVIDDQSGNATVPNLQVWDFQKRATFRGVGGLESGFSRLRSASTSDMALLRDAFVFDTVYLQDIFLDSSATYGDYYFTNGGYARTHFKEKAFVNAINSEIVFIYNSAVVPTPFLGGGLNLYSGSILRYDAGTSESKPPAGNSFFINADSSVQFRDSSGVGITAQQWKAWLDSKILPNVLNLRSSANSTAFAPISGMTLPYNSVQEAIKWLFDNRQTGGSFTAQQSVSLTGGVLTLVNDQANPGANKVYGTDANGLRTWRDAPSGGGVQLDGSNLWTGPYNTFATAANFTGPSTFTGSFNVTTNAVFGANIVLGSVNGGIGLQATTLNILTGDGAGRNYKLLFPEGTLSDPIYAYTLPSKSGVLATLDDIVGGGGGLAYTKVATLNDVVGNITPRIVDITSDSSNGGARTLYLHTGTDMWRLSGTVVALPNVTPPAPTGGVVDDGANTFTFTPATGYAATDHERRWRTGGVYTAWAACTSNVISVGNIDIAAGDLEVRVSAASGRNAGPVLVSAAAFTGVAFREPFVNITGSGADISTIGWTILFNHPTTGSGQTAPSPNTYLVQTTGAGSGVPVNAGYSTESNSGLLSFSASRDTMFAFTTKFTASRASQQPQRARFHLGNGRIEAKARIALRIGTAWYIYEQEFNNATAISSAANFAAQAILCETVFSGANWRTLSTGTLNTGSTLVSLPGTGDVTGIGVYMKDTANSSTPLRFDCVELIMG